jgi:hypothetical protein
MKRRSYLTAMLAAAAGLKGAAAQTAKKNPIVLYCDLSVDPAKEQEMLHNFHTVFKPAAIKHPGYIDVKMLKLRQALQGAAPVGVNYRFQLTYESDELRQQWVASAVHKKAWPMIESSLRSKDYVILLCDSV